MRYIKTIARISENINICFFYLKSSNTLILPSERDNLRIHVTTLFDGVWKTVFWSQPIKEEYGNLLNVFHILLFIPLSDAKGEPLFSVMSCMKTNWGNWLFREHLDAMLIIKEEGPSLDHFDPNKYISLWFEGKASCLGISSHRYPKSRKVCDKETTNNVKPAFSYLENEGENDVSETPFFTAK